MKKKRSGARAGDEAANAENRVFFEESSGFVGETAAVCREGNDGRAAGNPTPREAEPAGWMTPGLIEKTHAVWSKRYGRSLGRDEVLEILRNVRWFGELMRRALKGGLTT